MEQLAARRAHNPKVGGSSPPPATKVVNFLELSTCFILEDFNMSDGLLLSVLFFVYLIVF